MPVFGRRAPSRQFLDNGAGLMALTGFAIGTAFGAGSILSLSGSGWWDFGLFCSASAIFHLWEFAYVAAFHPGELDVHSFLLPPSHSQEFTLAFVLALVEYFFERWVLGFYGFRVLVVPGLLIVVAGQAIRTLAMVTAGQHFHHQVRDEKEQQHKLVTHGIYAHLRHPSYFGWFYWAIGMQLILCNPIMAAVNAYAAFKFFSTRIEEEEKHLVRFFGEDYERFRKSTPVGIPGIA